MDWCSVYCWDHPNLLQYILLVLPLVYSILPCLSTFHTALVEALTEIEAKTGTVTFEPSSAGYKAFADKVKALAQAHKIPWQLLVASQAGAADEATADSLARDYQAWLQSAHMQDVGGLLLAAVPCIVLLHVCNRL